MATEWYYTINGQQAPAPLTPVQLKQLATTNQLQPTDLVWQDGMDNWMPASSIKGLFGSSTRSSAVEQPALVEPAPGTMKPKKPVKKTTRDEEEDESSGGLLDLHPLLVLLLAVVTVGNFGLIYVYLTCRAFRRQAKRREKDGAGKPLGQPRHPVGVLVLTFLTLGIYLPFWASRAIRECRDYTGRKDVAPRNELTLMLILPPYTIFVLLFRVPELIREVRQQAKLTESPAGTPTYLFLNPFFLPGLPILAMLQQDALNQAWLQAPGSDIMDKRT